MKYESTAMQVTTFPKYLLLPGLSETPAALPDFDFVWNTSPDNLKWSTYEELRAIYSKVCVTENIAVFLWWVLALLMNCNWKTVASLFSNSSQHSQGKREGAKEGNRHKDKTQTNWKFTNHLYSETEVGGGTGVWVQERLISICISNCWKWAYKVD